MSRTRLPLLLEHVQFFHDFGINGVQIIRSRLVFHPKSVHQSRPLLQLTLLLFQQNIQFLVFLFLHPQTLLQIVNFAFDYFGFLSISTFQLLDSSSVYVRLAPGDFVIILEQLEFFYFLLKRLVSLDADFAFFLLDSLEFAFALVESSSHFADFVPETEFERLALHFHVVQLVLQFLDYGLEAVDFLLALVHKLLVCDYKK